MNCQDVQNQLKAFSIGELPADVRQTVQVHVSECEACRSELAKIDVPAVLLAAVQTPPIPMGFTARVVAIAQQRLETEQIESWNLIRWWRLTSAPMHAAAAAGLVLGLTIGLLMGATSVPASTSKNVQPDPVDTYQLDYLGEAPGGSLADSYFALAATTTE